jgi:hypothetical protein
MSSKSTATTWAIHEEDADVRTAGANAINPKEFGFIATADLGDLTPRQLDKVAAETSGCTKRAGALNPGDLQFIRMSGTTNGVRIYLHTTKQMDEASAKRVLQAFTEGIKEMQAAAARRASHSSVARNSGRNNRFISTTGRTGGG